MALLEIFILSSYNTNGRSSKKELFMSLKPKEAYLHIITGGFDNNKRRAVRKLFSEPSAIPQNEESNEESDEGSMEQQAEATQVETSNKRIDIAVGILEEFYAINVELFTLNQAVEVVSIFGLEQHFKSDISESLRECFNSPKLRLSSPDIDVWVVPVEVQIERLLKQFCKIPEDQTDKSDNEWRSMTPAGQS